MFVLRLELHHASRHSCKGRDETAAKRAAQGLAENTIAHWGANTDAKLFWLLSFAKMWRTSNNIEYEYAAKPTNQDNIMASAQ